MDMKAATELRKSWGDKPCDHPHIVKEDPGPYGQWSGDWVCTRCGYSGPRQDFAKPKNQTDPP
jgi:hypothetical protein